MAGVAGLNSTNKINGCDDETGSRDPAETAAIPIDCRTSDSPAALLKRNLAEQSKWLNDETGDRSWATHETQQIAWMMGVQVEALAKGK
jgi:hypothetical protein